ncbi:MULTISPECIES: LysR family transcriptional regulator [unclassified Vibrio]|uniref:LysR family transcriptional regulator n=1 Tax=Vibrio sp. HB236076 TaxID=3232307 RepID=A0AB39HLU1_9VIBR|nr:LysR family transcriptional regulator [Vibrio sp. HB161653]MDP5252576.1 LysR family transcriptional regulator [Vibrio sp. HB161653]
MDVKVFRTFLEVAKVRHFGRAAENLYITQAAVSARIKQLESYFDAQLFQRDRNNIQLTSAGERLISYAEIMVNTLQQAKMSLSLEKDQSLQLTLAGTANIWDAFLQNGLSLITESFSGYGFLAEVMPREQLTRRLSERTLDMAFSLEQIKSDEITYKHIADLSLIFVSTEAQFDENNFNAPYVYVDWGTRFASEHSERHVNANTPYLRTSTARIALDFILERGGCAYLPISLAKPFVETKQLYINQDQQAWSLPIYLSYRKNSTSIEAIQQVEALLSETDPFTSYSLLQAGKISDGLVD